MADSKNGITLSSYAERFREYGRNSTSILTGSSKDWIDGLLAGLSPDAAIFEIGTAHGRDARYIRSRGYAIQCSDAVLEFVADIQGQGLPAIRFNVLTDPFDRRYDLIVANAVMLHFSSDEFDHALRKTIDAVSPGGRFAFSLKHGYGSEWSNAKIDAPRYFRYWTEDELVGRLKDHGVGDFTVDVVTTDRAHAAWIYVVVRCAETEVSAL